MREIVWQVRSFIVITNNGRHLGDEEPYRGYWAYTERDYYRMRDEGGYGALGKRVGPYPTRGHGDSPAESIACLLALLLEEEDPENVREWQRPFLFGNVA